MRKRMGWRQTGKYGVCLAAGIFLYIMAETASGEGSGAENYALQRKPWGQGDTVYPLSVAGVEEEEIFLELEVPEQKLSKEEGTALNGEIAEELYRTILGENPSLSEVRTDLSLTSELTEYGLTVTWESEEPDILSSSGLVNAEGISETGETVYLKAELSNGIFEETLEFPVTLYPESSGKKERFMELLQNTVLSEPGEGVVKLPEEFEGNRLVYRDKEEAGNEILMVLGAVAAGCLYLKEKKGEEEKRKKREASFLLDYSEILSRFIILMGAGYTIRQAWKKMLPIGEKGEWVKKHPIYEEMQITWNQLETGVGEMQAYGDFGRRCGLRCYTRFASLLQNSLQTGGKNLRRLLEAEMEDAFEQRKDIAKRLGEEASTKLLIPLFLILGVVMVMIVAPAFLTLV